MLQNVFSAIFSVKYFDFIIVNTENDTSHK